MPSNRRFFIHGTIIMVSFRTEDGLPFVPVPFINEIFWSCLAKAQSHYPQEVITFATERNQVHMLLKIVNPEHVPLFIGYLKQETAHAVNRLLGRKKKTVWVNDYDAPTILDLDTFLDKFCYCLLNPVKDEITDSMDKYPGVSSWQMLKTRKTLRRCTRIARNSIPALTDPERPLKENAQVLRYLKEHNKSEITFRLSPYAWTSCFPDSKNFSEEYAHNLLMNKIDQYLVRLHELKKLLNKEISRNPEKLQQQSMLQQYVPRKFGIKTICLGASKVIRAPFIAMFKTLSGVARMVSKQWRKGDFSLPFPPGLFPPALPRIANIVPHYALA